MSDTGNHPLRDAIAERERRYMVAIDAVREAEDDNSDLEGVAEDLREAFELVRCLRRLLDGRTVQEIHRAFGAPGDFGYETPIGKALSRLYRGEP
jgi:predicted RNase H-like nuclease (RuvC/YqgF family)